MLNFVRRISIKIMMEPAVFRFHYSIAISAQQVAKRDFRTTPCSHYLLTTSQKHVTQCSHAEHHFSVIHVTEGKSSGDAQKHETQCSHVGQKLVTEGFDYQTVVFGYTISFECIFFSRKRR